MTMNEVNEFMIEDILKIVGGLLFAALVTTAVVSIVVTYLDEGTVRSELKNRNISRATIKEIVTDDSVAHIKFDAIREDDEKVEVVFEAQDYDPSEIYEGAEIHI